MSQPVLRPCPAPILGSTLLVSAALLSACGGGGDDSAAPAPTPPAPNAVSISGKVVDGPLAGATACYDLNDNGACDSGEPTSAATGANGAFTLAVAAADVGRHRIVVQVPATAVDADTGAAVGTAFTLQSPATGTTTAHAVFVSPLTSLVQGHADATGVTIAEATTLIQTQAGLGMSPLADFTVASNADTQQAALVARLVQATALAQADALKDVAGQTDLSGATASAADVGKQVVSAVIGALPSIAGKAAESSLRGASGGALTDAIASAAKAVVAQAGITADEAKAAIGTAKLPPDTATAGATPAVSLTALRHVDANNWFMRSLQSSAADNTADSAGLTRYTSVYMQSQSSGYSSAGVTQAWARGASYARRGDLHWNGTAWVACKLGDRSSSTPRDAQGRASYNHCDGAEKGRSARRAVDLAGQSIATVFTGKIRPYPGGANGVAYADWGPRDPASFGSASFPAGARLFYQSNTITETAFSYEAQDVAIVTAFSAEIAAGGDARSTAGLACAGTTTATVVGTLEELIARNPGKPCLFAKFSAGSDASLDPNEWWSNSTVSLATLTGAATKPEGSGNYYSTDLRLRVAFAGGDSKATTYYRCLSRSSNGSARNCTALGSGSYSIQTLGDARVLSFAGLPAQMQQAGYSRIFVERGGKVYFGYQNPAGITTHSLRMNLEAANAVLAALPGMPALNPSPRHADLSAASQAALAAAKGVWILSEGDGVAVLRIGDNGRYLFGQATPASGLARSGHELGWMSYDAASRTFTALVEGNSAGEGGLLLRSYAEQGSETLTISATQLSSSLGAVFSRAASDATSIVGLWAGGSATEFNTQHILFLPNGKLLMIDPLGDTQPGICQTERKGPAGAEYASYSYDAASGALQISGKLYDTNGCAGFFDIGSGANSSLSATVQLSPDGRTATVTVPDGVFTIHRIAPQ
jgi:hypothetical protein